MIRRSIGRGRVALIAALVALAAPARAEDVVAFRGVRVFDGEKAVGPTTVLVERGLIRQIGPDAEVPEGDQVVDGAGKTLLPGLFDCHTHTFTADQLRQAAVFGVTTELDMFTDAAFAATMRSQQREGRATDRADLLSAGTLVTAPGGHGTEYGIRIPTITTPDQAEGFVASRLAEGSDYIKIVYDDGKAVGLNWKTIDRPRSLRPSARPGRGRSWRSSTSWPASSPTMRWPRGATAWCTCSWISQSTRAWSSWRLRRRCSSSRR
jgi:hypothetical protein